MSDRRTDEVYARLEDIDREILRSVERRARLVEDLIKARTGNSVLLPIADGAHLATLERAAQGTLPPAAVRSIFEAVDAACRVYEVAPNVTYVGVEGGFGFLAPRVVPQALTDDAKATAPGRGHRRARRGGAARVWW